MDHRLVVTASIEPRLPLRLVTVRAPSFAGWARKEFVYTPLALIFRRARAAKNGLTPPIIMISRDGSKVVIAPKLEFTIQWAERLRSQSDHRQQLTKRNWKEREGALLIPHPITARNQLTPVTAGDNQERKEGVPSLSLPYMAARHYQILSGDAVQLDLKQVRKRAFLFAVPGRHGLNLVKVYDQHSADERSRTLSMHSIATQHYSNVFMRADVHRELKQILEHAPSSAVLGRGRLNQMRIDDQRNVNESPRATSIQPIVSMRNSMWLSKSFVQQGPHTTDETLSDSTFTVKQNMTLRKFIDQQTKRDQQETTSIPSVVAKSELKLVSRERPATHSVKSIVLSIPTGNDFSKSGYRKRSTFIDQQTKRDRHETTSIPSVVAKSELKLVSRERPATHSAKSIVLSITTGTDFSKSGYRKRSTETKPLLRHHRDETAMVLASAIQHSHQTLPARVGFDSKFHRGIHVFEHQRNMIHQSWKIGHESVTSTTHRTTKHKITSSAPRKAVGTDQIELTAGRNTNTRAISHPRPVTDYGNPPCRTGNHGNYSGPQMRADHRQPSFGHERRISPTEMIYRAENVASPPTESVPPSPAPVPIETPQVDIDRLSHDVWRQLEKRIRIERERHGLL